jgi:hypothetical protein
MGIHGHVRTKGYFSGQFLFTDEIKNPAYGYLYTHNGANRDDAMLDFNREKDGAYSKYTPKLPVTNFTYDIYSVSGQGIGGMYRPFRNDVGILFDSEVRNFTAGIDYPGIETGIGGVFHFGMDVSVNESDAYSGKWNDENDIRSAFSFRGETEDYEAYYFKQAGEKIPDADEAMFNNLGDFDAVRINLKNKTSKAEKELTRPNDVTTAVANETAKRTKRAKRNEAISFLNASEASMFGLEKSILAYKFSPTSTGYLNNELALTVDRTSKPAHHISEVSSYRADGARYVYGIPAYNTVQKEVSFATEYEEAIINQVPESGGPAKDFKTGLVSYVPVGDHPHNSVRNDQGEDHFFDRTTMPPFAHSYLLTAVLSPDYVDQTGNGPSEDDLGDYTKINYSVLFTNTAVSGPEVNQIRPFKWRTPYGENNANFNEGLRRKRNEPGRKSDNKGNYIYGEKEVWYMHSIETKDYVAYFFTSDREDGLETKGENGGKGTARPKKLDSIVLYSKRDITVNAASLQNVVPIKTIHFDYTYNLCKKTENALVIGNGKLTLTGIYFTYGNSYKAKQRGYKFFYGLTGLNKDTKSDDLPLLPSATNYNYNMKAYDRWGNFKAVLPMDQMSNAEFPYAEQNKTLADKYAAAWAMNAIELPSGGIIKVEYEADDYAYVQDKRAMEMIKVVAVSKDKPWEISPSHFTSSSKNDLYDANFIGNLTGIEKSPHQYLYFPIPKRISDEELKAKYFCERDGSMMRYLFYRFNVKIKKDDDDRDNEYISGYIDTKNIECGVCSSSSWPTTGQQYAWIRLKPVELGDFFPTGNAHPISHNAWNFVKLNFPQVANDKESEYDNMPFIAIFKAIYAVRKQMQQLIKGFYFDLRKRNIAQSFIPEKSFIRLYSPEYKKMGGGSRVKTIRMSDQFDEMVPSGQKTFYSKAEYGQQYDYTKIDEYGRTISSGVAAYEPLIGGEENPFRQPIILRESKILVPSEDHIQEEPFGESFFPGASVGYSKITVSSIRAERTDAYPANTIMSTGTGKVVHEFYTAKDFPTKVRETTTEAYRNKPYPLFRFFKLYSEDNMTVSGGYCIELNDMHGKPKAQKVYAEGDSITPISSIAYYYKTDPSDGSRLNNQALVIDKAGKITQSNMVGVDFDMIADMREQVTKSRSAAFNGNLESFVALLPMFIPMILGSSAKENVRFRSAVVTKVINRYGILDRTVATDQTSTITTSNVVYDQNTGEVLLTKTANQFDDPVYAFTYPAHWAYENMGPASINLGVTVPVDVALAQPAKYFVPGDELIVGSVKGWVTSISPALSIMDATGFSIDIRDMKEDGLIESVKVIRSGRKNQQTVPMGKFTSLSDPVQNIGGGVSELAYNNIIHAEATVFTQESGLFCECGLEKDANGVYPPYNPYVKGKKGFWKVKRSYLKLTDRTQARLNGNINARRDGVYTQFNPFYKPNNGSLWQMDATGWTYTSEVTLFSPHGHELENRDALNRYSSSVYGYNNKLPILVASNAQYREAAFDNFEDYGYYDAFCATKDQHFGYKKSLQSVSNPADIKVSTTTSHTGKRSMMLRHNLNTIKVKRVITPCPQN